MNIKIREEDGISIVTIDNMVMQEHIPVFRDRLVHLIEEKKSSLIIDMLESHYLSSMGISVLLEIRKVVADFGGELVLVNVNNLIRSLFEMTNLLSFFKIYENTHKAIEVLKKINNNP